MALTELLSNFGLVLAVLAVYTLAEMLALCLERWADATREKRYVRAVK
jgi:hypothetical protein